MRVERRDSGSVRWFAMAGYGCSERGRMVAMHRSFLIEIPSKRITFAFDWRWHKPPWSPGPTHGGKVLAGISVQTHH